MVQQNPFLSQTFIEIWSKHFLLKHLKKVFEFINIGFYKPSLFPIYVNLGATLTKGVSYNLKALASAKELKQKALLIYDVPAYFNKNEKSNNEVSVIKVKQYPGYLINLKKYNGLNHYLTKVFSKSSRQKFKRYSQRLEQCYNIHYKMYFGAISIEEYNHVFNAFHALLTKRFIGKQTVNNNLFEHEWNFYRAVVYPLILEKKASLNVIYNANQPISIRLNYYSDTIVFDAITVFDTDYSKFHLGKISILKILEWVFEQPYEIFDFSKGYFDYKESWSDQSYNFEYHLLYNSASITSSSLAFFTAYYFRLKHFLRTQKLNEKFHSLQFLLKHNKKAISEYLIKEVTDETLNIEPKNLTPIVLDNTVSYLKKPANDFLYLSKAHCNDLKVFKLKTKESAVFLLTAKQHQQLLEVIKN